MVRHLENNNAEVLQELLRESLNPLTFSKNLLQEQSPRIYLALDSSMFKT